MTAASADLERVDPKQLIRQALELDDADATSARDCLLLWLMSLPDEVDPADAAGVLLETVFAAPAATRGAFQADLAAELLEVSRYPRASLPTGRPRRRRKVAGPPS